MQTLRSTPRSGPGRVFLLVALASGLVTPAFRPLAADLHYETPRLEFRVSEATGRYEIRDKAAGHVWRSNPQEARFGEVTLLRDGGPQRVALSACEATREGETCRLVFRPTSAGSLEVRVRVVEDGTTLEFSYRADPGLRVESVRLLDEAVGVTRSGGGAVLVPVREGLWVPADSGRDFTQRFDTYAYEGCHLAMVGLLENGAAALAWWEDPYVQLELRSRTTNAPAAAGGQILTSSLVLRKSATSFRLRLLGPGDAHTVAAAYRDVARARGWLVPWSEKLASNPDRARLFGASNYKLWSLLTRRMDEASAREESVRVNWTFDEAAQVAEHLRQDLQLERVLFILGGWIRRGYDNQHPDILPAAPELGGSEGLAACARRVKALGYLLGLHDNYQDLYRDSPSWDERLLMRQPDGSLARGGRWAGGRAYLTCSRQALGLAQRPQNLPAVFALTGPAAYFIDTTYAAGLQECFDAEHPLTRAEDLRWKQALSDYARGVFGMFGSECGREWAIPHSDFFEGLTGVSGTSYHNAALPEQLGAVSFPLFELVYRDTIALYGKYGYDIQKADAYVLHHLSLGRPLHYHSVPSHLYWKEAQPPGPLALRPAVAHWEPAGPRRFRLQYQWDVERPVPTDWRVLVHFTDADGEIRFQNDYVPDPPTSAWKVGRHLDGPFLVSVPPGLDGTFDVRLGLFGRSNGPRAALPYADDGEQRFIVGRVRAQGDTLSFLPVEVKAASPGSRDARFVRAESGWAEGLHPFDRFVKNTHEVLSPLNELTAPLRLTRHEFLGAGRQARRSVFGEAAAAVEVVINPTTTDLTRASRWGGSVVLPPGGFLVEGPTYAAFCARRWNGLDYAEPSLFTLRSRDGQPLDRSRKVRIFHASGTPTIRVGGRSLEVRREMVVDPQAP